MYEFAQVGLLNVNGYYDAILTLFEKALDEGFLNLASHNIVVSASSAAELLDKLKVLSTGLLIYNHVVDYLVSMITSKR